MDQNQEMMELLRQLNKTNRQQVRWARLQTFFMLLTTAVCVVLFVAVRRIMPELEAMMEQMQDVLDNLELTTKLLSQLDLEGMVSNVDELVTTAQESLSLTMVKLNTIDFGKLNDAIQDLAAVIEPVANFFNRLR